MPFKLKLKKSRQYNVSSKNLFVLSVELLDNTTVECTLSSQSLGQECLSNVCQRLGLQQPQYFGLRFVSKKGGVPWWVDLSRPLKRQLDKESFDPSSVGLQVMFFVHDVQLLHDEVTRYHYFLQLKSDILEGKLPCTEEQTIQFASYSLQAEFGDHDPERHTTEYLTNFGLLPKHLGEGGGKESREALLEQVILNHQSLQGMTQQLAEVYYIKEAQGLRGYGLECFTAKDQSGSAIIVGVSSLGIYIWILGNQPPVYYPWDQILNLVHHKRCFGIEHRKSPKVLQCQMEDTHFAKYVWKISIQQHGFYTKNEGHISIPSDLPADTPLPNVAPVVINHKQSPGVQTKNKQVEKKSHRSIQESQESLDGLGIYHTKGRYSERIKSTKSCNKILDGSQQDLKAISVSSNTLASDGSNASVAASLMALSAAPTQLQPQNQLHSSAPHLRRSSSVDVHPNPVNDPTKPICSVLPMYRQAPDYDTAVKMKYGVQSSSSGDVSSAQIQPVPESYSQYKNYTDLSHLDVMDAEHRLNPAVLMRSPEFVSTPSLHPSSVHTSSSPNLAPAPVPPRPPPPYRCRGSSTPNLSSPATAMLSNKVLPYQPVGIGCTTVITSSKPVIVSSVKVNQQQPPLPTYENYPPENPSYCQSEPLQSGIVHHEVPLPGSEQSPIEESGIMGPMLLAAMNGLSMSRPSIVINHEEETSIPLDNRVQALEQRLAEGRLFLEFEQIPKKRPDANFATALLPENAPRNRFRDVFPYEDNRVRLTPTSENRTGYINASHLSISLGPGVARSYIAAQGPLPNTLYSFWQLIWEHNVLLVVMLTQVQELGMDKCFPYWPQEDGNQLQIGEFQIVRNFSMSSPSYVTCSLTLVHVPTSQQRSVWHIRFTDWHDHSCPTNTHGFIAFLGEVDAVRRHSGAERPLVVHCSAGVGRSGTLILSDIMLHHLDHYKPINLPKVLTHLRFQRMLTVQTLAQYTFVYHVLIQYLKNSRLI